MTTIFDVGQAVPLAHKVYVDGVLTAVPGTALTLIAPDGTITTPSVTSPATGVYRAAPTATAAGPWSYTWDVPAPVDDEVYGTFYASDPAPPLYASLERVRAALGRSDTTADELITEAIEAASRMVEKHCGGRLFYIDPTPTVREYRVSERAMDRGDGHELLVDDIGSLVGLTVAYRTGGPSSPSWVTVTDYDVEPLNALAVRRPATKLRSAGGWVGDLVRVTARHGWPAIPSEVAMATRIQATRLHKRKDSPEGILGNAEWGTVRLSKVDPDVAALLADFVLTGD